MMRAAGALPGGSFSLCPLGESHPQHCLSVVKQGFPCYRAHPSAHKQTCREGSAQLQHPMSSEEEDNRQEQKLKRVGKTQL